MARLSRAGFKKDFVRAAILPDWWDESCAEQEDLLPEIDIRVARFLGLPLSALRDHKTLIAASAYPGAQLRRVQNVDRDRLAPAIHSALSIAAAVVRSLNHSVPAAAALPVDGFAWREQMRAASRVVTLEHILGSLWEHGIPVIPVDVLPTPSFQGIAGIVEGRPVILLCQKHDEPGRLAFFIGHEAGHVAAGDCRVGQPVVDEEEELPADAEMERRADRYATRALVGADAAPSLYAGEFKDLANRAAQVEKDSGADAGAVIFAWAARTRDYAKATMA